MTTDTETKLLKAAQQGNIEAYEHLQHRLEAPIRRFVSRITCGADLVEDIVQDVFIAFYANLKRIDPPENMRAYLFRIARNRAWDELRYWQRHPTLSLDEEPNHINVSFINHQDQKKPDELVHWMLVYLEVQEAMSQLPPLQQQTLYLFSEENLTHAEIAEIMQTSVGTVKSRLYYAKQALRRMVHPETLAVIENDL